MKNVAGFDVAADDRCVGTLGVLTEVSLKCLPLPKVEVTQALECSADEAIRRSNEWGGKPLPVSATCHHAGRLVVVTVGFGGRGRSGQREDRGISDRGRRCVLGEHSRP